MSGSDSGAVRTSLIPITRTNATGYNLVNGTGPVTGISTPNDGQLHAYYVAASLNVTVLEVGGQITLTWHAGGVAYSTTMFAAALAVSTSIFSQNIVADPNTTININQATALTSGASNMVATIAGG